MPHWILAQDGEPELRKLYEQHYSCHKIRMTLEGGMMTDKRPWSPGPWDGVLFRLTREHPNFSNNYKLASKAPDMAELLIELLNPNVFLYDLKIKAKQLLAEVRYKE